MCLCGLVSGWVTDSHTHTHTHTHLQDFARYNELALTDEELAEANREMREETGWKLVYGDVFRPPPMARVLSVCMHLCVCVCMYMNVDMYRSIDR